MRQALKRLGRFLVELRRRKVVRTALVYALGGVALIESTNALVEAFGLPPVVFRIVAILTLAGLPIVLVLSWAHGITSEGIRPAEAAPQRAGDRVTTELSRRGRFAATVALVGLISLTIVAFVRIRPAAAADPLA